MAFLDALGEAVSPPVRAYVAWCESPAAYRAAQVLNAAPLLLSHLAVAMLTPAKRDADAWYCECVEYAWGQGPAVTRATQFLAQYV